MANFLAGVGPGIEAGVRTAGAIQNIWDKQEEGDYNRVVRPIQLAGLQRADTMGKMSLEKAQYEDAQNKLPIDYKAIPGWDTLDQTFRVNAENQIKNMGGDRRAFKAYVDQNKDNTEVMTHFATAKLAGFKNNFDEANARLTDLQEKLKLNPGDKAIELQIRALKPQVAGLAERVRGSEKTAEHVLGLMEAEEKYNKAPEEWKRYLAPQLKNPAEFNKTYSDLMKGTMEIKKYEALYAPGGYKDNSNKMLQEAHIKGVKSSINSLYEEDKVLGPVIKARLKNARVMNPQASVTDVLEPYQLQEYNKMVAIGAEALQKGIVKNSIDAGIYARDNRLKLSNPDTSYKGEQDQPWSVTSTQDKEQIDKFTQAVTGKRDQVSKVIRDPKTSIIQIVFTDGSKVDIPPTRKPGGAQSMEFRRGGPPNPVASSMEFRGESPTGSTGLGATREKKVYRLEDYLGK